MPVLRKTADGQIPMVHVCLCFLFLVIVGICFRWRNQSPHSNVGSSYHHEDVKLTQLPDTIRSYESRAGGKKLRGQIMEWGGSRRHIREFGGGNCGTLSKSARMNPTPRLLAVQKLNSRDMEVSSDTEKIVNVNKKELHNHVDPEQSY